MTTTKIWKCKIGEVDSVAGGADHPMRQAVAAAYREITGSEPVFIFSGWGALLTEAERAVVENKLQAPATAPEFPVNWAQMIHYPDCWDTAAYPELRDAIHEALAWYGCRVCKPATAPEQCWCDEQGIGKPGVSCGDCPTRDYKATAPEQDATKQIAEALRKMGLTLVHTGDGYKVMKLGEITAQEDKP